jgi:hypothetical protein
MSRSREFFNAREHAALAKKFIECKHPTRLKFPYSTNAEALIFHVRLSLRTFKAEANDEELDAFDVPGVG